MVTAVTMSPTEAIRTTIPAMRRPAALVTVRAAEASPAMQAAAAYFASDERRRQAQEDTFAWWSVCSVLVAVVSSGALGMALTVLWIVCDAPGR